MYFHILLILLTFLSWLFFIYSSVCMFCFSVHIVVYQINL